jgi:tetratricopeptide (TPR) repeat protein
VNEFNYGSPHPQQRDLRAEKHEANKRAAKCYLDKLSQANALLHSGAEDSATGLVLFDLESTNIRRWQSWADNFNETNPEDEFVAELCRAFPRDGAPILELRAHPTERIRWAMACLRARGDGQDRAAIVTAFSILGLAWLSLGDPHQAIQYDTQLLTFSREINDRSWESAALNNLGVAYGAIGQYRKALGFLQQSAETVLATSDRFSQCKMLGNLGAAEQALGNYPQALSYHQRAFALASEIGHRIIAAQSLGNLGQAIFASGDRATGVTHYNEALALARETGDRVLEADMLYALGDASLASSDFQQAYHYHEEALHIVRETGSRRAEGQILSAMGRDWDCVGNATAATRCFQQSLEIARKIGDVMGEARTSFAFAESLHASGWVDDAIGFGERAVQLYEQIESPLAEQPREALAKWRPATNPNHFGAFLLVRSETPDGTALYDYLAIRSDKIESFLEATKQLDTSVVPEDYGIVIESGEGEPSEEVKARMMREYGFNTDAMIDPRDVLGS